MMGGPTDTQATPALVLGGYLTVLGTLRALAWAGIPRYCLTSPESYVRCSRHHVGPHPGCAPISTPAELATYLEKLPLQRGVLIACSDEWALACAGLDPDLKRRFRYSGPSLDELEALLDKAQLEDRLESLGIDRPRTRWIQSEEDLDWLASTPDATWFLKPANSQAFRRRFGRKAIRVGSLEEARGILHQCREHGLEMLLQEYIPGSADRHYFVDGFVDRSGELTAILGRRRIRMHPRDFGDSSFLIGVELEEVRAAAEACRRLLAGGRFRGIFSTEFKRDPRDGRFRLIEVNARPWAYVQFAASCGFNAPAMAYRDALELEDQPPVLRHVGARFQILPQDLKAMMETRNAGELRIGDWLRQSWGAQSALWRMDDPLPALDVFGHALGSGLGRLLGRRGG